MATVTQQFNIEAAGAVYANAGLLVKNDGTKYQAPTWNPMTWGSTFDSVPTADQINMDATIKGAGIDVNLDALAAGSDNSKKFADVIRQHPELKAGADALLKDEGGKALETMQGLLTGDGAVDMAEFEKMMQDPGKRAVVAQMLNKVGTSQFGMDYAARFTRDAISASQNPDDPKKRETFLETLRVGGIDPTPLASGGEMLAQFWNDPKKFVAQFVDTLNLSPDMKASLTGILGEVASFYKDTLNYYANGDGNQPGLIQIGQNIMDNSRDNGNDIRRNAGFTVAAPNGP